jgi:hypothetical protein
MSGREALDRMWPALNIRSLGAEPSSLMLWNFHVAALPAVTEETVFVTLHRALVRAVHINCLLDTTNPVK